jgi:hypothetical protein
MGGFHLVEPVEEPPEAITGTQGTETDTERGHAPGKKPEGRVTILTLEMLRDLVHRPDFEIRMTEAEVADKSKGDALSKVIFTLQSSWFISQCIARRVQGLSLTQLELTTLALASLNGITLFLWLDKPLGVQAPVRVYMKCRLTDEERKAGEVSDLLLIAYHVDMRLQRGRSGRTVLLQNLAKIPRKIRNLVARHVANLRNHVAQLHPCDLKAVAKIIFMAIVYLIVAVFEIAVVIPVTLIVAFGSPFLATVYDLLGGATSFPVDATHVSTFYVPSHEYSSWWHILLLAVLGSMFGVIHCAGWNLLFPTSAERKLWRVASLIVTILPVSLPSVVMSVITSAIVISSFIAISFLLRLIFRLLSGLTRGLGLTTISNVFDRLFNLVNPFFNDLLDWVTSKVLETGLISDVSHTHVAIRNFKSLNRDQLIALGYGSAFLFAYAAARLVLLGLALSLLRHQPPSAFIAIDWGQFYPHIL